MDWVNTLMVVGLLGFSLWFAMYGYGVVPEDADCSLHDQTHSNLVENFAYPWIMNHRFRVKTPSKLALVTVSDRNEPLSVTGNVCESRRFLAALLRQLTDLGASVIAIDQSFSEGSCPEDDKSKEFGKALQTFGVPIVVGEAAHERPDAEAGGDRRDCLVETHPTGLRQRCQKA